MECLAAHPDDSRVNSIIYHRQLSRVGQKYATHHLNQHCFLLFICLSVENTTQSSALLGAGGGQWRRLPQCNLNPQPADTHTAGAGGEGAACLDLDLSLAAAGEILATCPTFLPLDTVHTCIKAWPPLARDKRSRNSTHLRRYTISWKLLVAQR